MARISQNEVLFAGGINFSFKAICDDAFIYNLQTRKVKKVPNMKKIRYTFSLIKFKNFVYAIGGREYGSDKNAIFQDCERLNLDSMQWERIEGLNISRCTSNAFIYKDTLMVAGGFC